MTNRKSKSSHKALSRSSDAIFTHDGWRIWRFDDKNIGLLREGESLNRTRYYATVGAALHGLAKQIGFYSQDLRDAVDRIDALNKAIERLGI